MRRLLFILVALAARALSLNQAVAQQDQQQTSNGEKEVTGIVTEADEETREITVNDQTFVMPEGGGAALFFPKPATRSRSSTDRRAIRR
jgi:hypothetical protein